MSKDALSVFSLRLFAILVSEIDMEYRKRELDVLFNKTPVADQARDLAAEAEPRPRWAVECPCSLVSLISAHDRHAACLSQCKTTTLRGPHGCTRYTTSPNCSRTVCTFPSDCLVLEFAPFSWRSPSGNLNVLLYHMFN